MVVLLQSSSLVKTNRFAVKEVPNLGEMWRPTFLDTMFEFTQCNVETHIFMKHNINTRNYDVFLEILCPYLIWKDRNCQLPQPKRT
jgi:hypothetical protein